MKEVKDNKTEAEVLLEYAKSIDKENVVLSILDAILTNKEEPESVEGWSWGIAELIQERTNYISIDMDADVDVETGDWGMPEITGGRETPIGIKIDDKENLMILRQELDNILNETNEKITKFISSKDRPKWKCQKCNRFLGKELSSIEEIKRLLRNFSIEKYWKCRSCKLLNYFIFDKGGIKFKSKALD